MIQPLKITLGEETIFQTSRANDTPQRCKTVLVNQELIVQQLKLAAAMAMESPKYQGLAEEILNLLTEMEGKEGQIN